MPPGAVLDVDTAAVYLLAEGLIARDSVVHGNLSVKSMTRRNRNLMVERDDGPGYLVKQPEDPAGEAAATLGQEAAFYSFCASNEDAAPLREVIPRLAHVGTRQPLLALELIRGAVPLWDYVQQFPPHSFPSWVTRRLGRALAIAHSTLATPGLADHDGLTWLRRNPPWILEVHRPSPALLSVISAANYQILQILQTQSGLSSQLDALRSEWESTCVIHGDVKSDNVLVQSGEGGSDARLHLVDWELVEIGDPAWDLAGALQGFVIAWILSMTPAQTVDDMIGTATYPLPVIQEAVRSTLDGYFEASPWPEEDLQRMRGRATRFAAARLIQSAYEFGQMGDVLPPTSVLLLQVAANILADPAGAEEELFGLESGGRAA